MKRKDRRHCTVYGLYDPDTDELRYIGQTRLTLQSRLKFHRKTAKKQAKVRKRMTPVSGWIFDLQISGKRPIIRALNDNATWNVTEIILIAEAKAKKIRLLNILRGGDDSLDSLKRETGFEHEPLHDPIDHLEREYRDIIGA